MDLTLGSDHISEAITGSNLQGLFTRAISLMQASGAPSTAILNYAGYPNAMTLNLLSPQRTNFVQTFTLSIPSSGFSRTFTNSSILSSQIGDVLRTLAPEQLGNLQAKVATASFIAINDGTPHGSTALLGARTYDQFGMEFGQTREEKQSAAESDHRVGLVIAPDAGWINAAGFHGSVWRLPIDEVFKLSDRVGLRLDLTPQYLEIENSKVYQLEMSFGLPVKLINRTAECPWKWQLTPSMGAVAAWSEDLDTGGWVIGGSLTSLVGYDFEHFTVSMGNQASFFGSTPISLGGYEFNPNVSQQLLKNGLDLDVRLGQRWIGEVYGIYSHFIQQAAVQDYVTVGASLSYRFQLQSNNILTKKGSLFVGLYADIANHYNSPHLSFGSAWKF